MTDIQMDSQTVRQLDSLDRQTDSQIDRQTDRQLDRQTERQTNRETEIQKDRKKDRHYNKPTTNFDIKRNRNCLEYVFQSPSQSLNQLC